jgi:hypothetical protein
VPRPLTTGAVLQCSMGAIPSVFVADPLPGTPMVLGGAATATVAQILPANILPFGRCKSMANPEVASATAAAQGALTPMPCTPMVAAPWTPPSLTSKSNMLPIATVSSKCLCSFGGSISVSAPLPGPADAT